MKFLDIPTDIGEYLTYDSSFPTGLRWIRARSFNTTNRKQAGSTKYRGKAKTEKAATELTFDGKVYKTARIVWFLHFGPIPSGMVIDHLDGDPWNNKIENLGCKTQRQNMQNQRQRSDNVSGVTGVYRTTIAGNGYWVGFYKDNDKNQVSKSFPIKLFGEDGAKGFAIQFRKEGIELMIKSGEMYTERHLGQL